tara:strand:- start:738 stop:980 length:243 start_codon:yes stop_codon:yes gene_type:complete
MHIFILSVLYVSVFIYIFILSVRRYGIPFCDLNWDCEEVKKKKKKVSTSHDRSTSVNKPSASAPLTSKAAPATVKVMESS